MQNNSNENYSQDDRNSKIESQNEKDVKADLALQQSPENGRDSNSGSFNAINRNNEQNQKEDYYAKDNLMPNPDDFDEGDDGDSQGKGRTRTPGL